MRVDIVVEEEGEAAKGEIAGERQKQKEQK